MIEVLLVDDHQLMRAGIARLLGMERDLRVVGQAANGEEAILRVEELQPHVVLMDVRMPGMDGITAAAEITRRWPQVAILLLTMFDDEQYVYDGLTAGVCGYLPKDCAQEDLLAAVRSASRGEPVLPPEALRKVLAEFRSLRQGRPATVAAGAVPSAPADPGPQISRREMEVLGLVVGGRSNKQIARELCIDETTVKTHLHRIFEKLQVRDRTQAAILALQRGWFTAPEMSYEAA